MPENLVSLSQRAKQVEVEDVARFKGTPIWALMQLTMVGYCESLRDALESAKDAPVAYIQGQLATARCFQDGLIEMMINIVQDKEPEEEYQDP